MKLSSVTEAFLVHASSSSELSGPALPWPRFEMIPTIGLKICCRVTFSSDGIFLSTTLRRQTNGNSEAKSVRIASERRGGKAHRLKVWESDPSVVRLRAWTISSTRRLSATSASGVLSQNVSGILPIGNGINQKKG